MLVVGITGSFGTGKTTVAGFFRELGAAVIDADKIAHEAYRPASVAYRKIVRYFGPHILSGYRRRIDRKKLAAAAFASAAKRTFLCRLIHPAVVREIKAKVRQQRKKGKRMVVIDAPLLIEAGLDNMVDVLVVVKAARAVQFRRLERKRGFSASDITARIKTQMPLMKKAALADYVIDNSGTISTTRKQVEALWDDLLDYLKGEYR